MDLDRLNYATLSLIPKQDTTKNPFDFQPISLVHSCIKIIMKVLVNRLKLLLTKLIDLAHTTYIKKRCIMDYIIHANEILLHSRRLDIDKVVCKLDFLQACDRLSPYYLIKLLVMWKFPPRWIRWSSKLLFSWKIVVYLNGEIDNWILYKYGLQQGDPPSPSLFILVLDPLSQKLNAATFAKISIYIYI